MYNTDKIIQILNMAPVQKLQNLMKNLIFDIISLDFDVHFKIKTL